ncbi:Kinectin-like protein [Hirschfeldia incana]|nr:Kinectin-like protein [Hirschfeldia incana]
MAANQEPSSSSSSIVESNIIIEEGTSPPASKQVSHLDIEVLWSRVNTATSLLTYLKSKATTLLVAEDLSQLSLADGLVVNSGEQASSTSERDQSYYVSEMLKHVETVSGVMDSLARRAIVAESEAAVQRGKALLSQQEVQRKAGQINSMSMKLEDMEKFALGTTSILGEMRQRVDDLVEETSRQKARATENEQELCRVRRDFESLKSYVSSLISVRETLVSSEKQFQTIERLFERLVAKTTQLESDKVQKEAEVQKLMEENVRLTALVDKKEAQLLAMNEQCKMMALSSI